MKIGVPKEIKNHEYRVGLTPESVSELVKHGHNVLIETNAGNGIGASNFDYIAAGAKIVDTADEVFEAAELIVKVKEPQAIERKRLRPHHLLFTYLHLAPDPEQTKDLLESGATCVAYETVTDAKGGLPLLKPMSQVAGRLSVQAGAAALEKSKGGRGVLLGGVVGVAPAKVTIIGGGVVGANAAEMAVGLGADVTILDRSLDVLENLNTHFGPKAKCLYSNSATLEACIKEADLVIGAVLAPGAAAPKLVTKDMLSTMKDGSVIADVAIDQGGCFETSKPTTHDDPTYVVDGVIHYCVANMPGAVARTSTFALNAATLPFVISLANKGWPAAGADDPHLLNGLNVWQGKLTCPEVGEALGIDTISPAETLNS